MSAGDREKYVREVSAVTSADARLLIVAVVPGSSSGVRGIEPAEIERRFAPEWTILASGDEPTLDRNGTHPARHYLLARASGD